MTDIALITPTSDRPIPFALCELWMSRAIGYYNRPVNWYVVDDGIVPVNCTMGQIHIRRPPSETPAKSLLDNLTYGLRIAVEQKILFIEDDDWYSEKYISEYSRKLASLTMYGESHAKSYCPEKKQYWVWDSDWHASLCQTGIQSSMKDWLIGTIRSTGFPYVDMLLWAEGRRSQSTMLAVESSLSVGMKGLPGKIGFTHGHIGQPRLMSDDSDGSVLKSWIGEDAELYLQ